MATHFDPYPVDPEDVDRPQPDSADSESSQAEFSQAESSATDPNHHAGAAPLHPHAKPLVLPGNSLSLEQHFQLETFRRQIETLSQQEAQDYLYAMIRQMMVKDNLVKEMFRACYL